MHKIVPLVMPPVMSVLPAEPKVLNAQDPTNLSDLRTPTPFVYVETYMVYHCAENPGGFYAAITAYVGPQSYSAASVPWVVLSDQVSIVLSWTFPELEVTILTPRELIEIVNAIAVEADSNLGTSKI